MTNNIQELSRKELENFAKHFTTYAIAFLNSANNLLIKEEQKPKTEQCQKAIAWANATIEAMYLLLKPSLEVIKDTYPTEAGIIDFYDKKLKDKPTIKKASPCGCWGCKNNNVDS